MVVPRKPILYKYFKELVQDGFQVFTRSVYPDYIPYRYQLTLDKNMPQLPTHIISVGLQTEVTSYLKDYKYIVGVHADYQLSDKTLVESGVSNAVKLHPEAIRTFSDLVYANFSNASREIGFWDSTKIFKSIHMEFQTHEMNILQRSIEKCHKSVVVLPDHDCTQIQSQMVRDKGITDVFIGTESYSDVDRLFTLSGPVSPRLIKRFHQMGESGIWEWWIKVLGRKNLYEIASYPVEASSMKGNIVIIFTLWIAGLIVSGTGLIVELCFICFRKILCTFRNDHEIAGV